MDSFPRGQRPQIQLPGRWLVAGATIIVVVFITLGAVDFTTEWLWFDALGFASVFITSILARLALFVAGALLFLAAFAINVLIARRLAAVSNIRPQRPAANTPWEDLLRQIGSQLPRRGGYAGLINDGLVVAGLFLAFFMGLLATGNWLAVLQFLAVD